MSKSLRLVIQHALQHGHLNPNTFNQLAKKEHHQHTLLLFGSLLLNQQHKANYYLNQITLKHQQQPQDFHQNLFKVCGLIGRGMGMMRRVINAQIKNNTPNQPIMEAYIENLVRWAHIESAWSLLQHRFDFGPNIHLALQAQAIGGRFYKRLSRIKHKKQDPSLLWKPTQSAYSSLLSIYLILNRTDLALQLINTTQNSCWDQPTALIICAKASSSSSSSIARNGTLTQEHSPPIGPITTAVLAKYIYQREGPTAFINWIKNQNSSNRLLLSAWLDILLLPTEPPLEPIQLAEWIQRLDQHDLLGERELEKYLRYTREWLEIQSIHHIRRTSRRHSSTSSSIAIDPDDPRLGYPQLINLFQRVYHHQDSSSSSETDFLRPSTIVVSEMIRILALIGTPPEQLNQLMDREMNENQGQIRSTHMIGLAWSRIVNQDLVGLNTLIDKEMKLKYKLVLTGLLTTIILAGLIAIRAPKPIIIKMSQKLIEQCPTTNNHHHHNAQPDSMESYLNLIKAAEAVGDLIMIKELHESMLAEYGRSNTHPWVDIDYLNLIMQVYMKLNEPLLAQTEVSLSLDYLEEHYLEISSSSIAPPNTSCCEDTKRFLSSGVLQSFLESQASSKLVDHRDCRYHDYQKEEEKGMEEMVKYEKFLGSLRRSGMQISKKLESLGRLRRILSSRSSSGEKGEQEWLAARQAQIDARIASFVQAQDLNLRLVERFQSFLLPHHSNPDIPPENSGLDLLNLSRHHRHLRHTPPNYRDHQWNQAMSLGLGLIRKLLG